MSGFAAINGFGDREPVLPPMYLADGFAGLFGASAALIALRAAEQERPRAGGRPAAARPAVRDARPAGRRLPPDRQSQAAHRQPLDQLRAAQRLPLQGRSLCGALGAPRRRWPSARCARRRPELIDDPRYRTNAERVKHAAELDAIIGAFVAERTQAENVAFFEQAEVTIGPIYDVRQILEDPHFIEREILADYPDDEMDAFPMHHVVPRLLGTPGSIRSPRRSSGSTTASCSA
jgi:formyl-CoA transferase